MSRLTSLTTELGDTPSECFGYPERVVLENLPSLSTVILEKAFQYVNDISVSNFLSSSYKKSVSICESNELLLTDPTVTHLTVNSNCLNELNELQLHRFVVLKELVIGSNSLNDVVNLKVIGMNALEELVIGSNSFSNREGAFELKDCPLMKKLRIANGAMREFNSIQVSGVPLLEGMEIGSNSFVNVAELRLIDLPNLKKVEIPESSFNEKDGVFELRNCSCVSELWVGNGGLKQFESALIEGLPSLERIAFGDDCLKNAAELRLGGLPKLRSVEVGEDSFTNKEGVMELSSCLLLNELRVGNRSMPVFTSLSLSALPSLKEIHIGKECFKKVSGFALSGLSALQYVTIGDQSFSQGSGAFSVSSTADELHVGANAFTHYSSCFIHDAPYLKLLSIEENSFRESSLELKSG